jgi:hypothetical protein
MFVEFVEGVSFCRTLWLYALCTAFTDFGRRFGISFFLSRFEVLTAASMKMAVFLVVAPYSLVEVYQRLRGTSCLIALIMESVCTSETLVSFYQTTRRYNPVDIHTKFPSYPFLIITLVHLIIDCVHFHRSKAFGSKPFSPLLSNIISL